MSISPDLFMAILAMDAYNRGYDLGLDVAGPQIGDAILQNVSLPAGYQRVGRNEWSAQRNALRRFAVMAIDPERRNALRRLRPAS